MPKAAGEIGKGLALLAGVAFPVLAHVAISGGLSGPVRIALFAVPLFALGSWAATRPGTRFFWMAALAATCLAAFAMERRGEEGLALAYGVPHAAAYLFLLWFFGRTLARGADPLITSVARRVHGALQPEMEAYTRRVTLAWCVFFAGQLLVSALLFAFAPLPGWSFFVNVLNVPLLALMFAGEYLCRVMRHPDHPRVSFASAMRAFAQQSRRT